MPRARCALAMTLLLQEGWYGIGGRTGASAPTGALLVVRRGGALPLPRATARVAPTEGLQEVPTCGRTGASAPTEAQQEVQWAGDRKGRPYGGVSCGAQGSLFCIEKTTVRVGRSFFIEDFTQPWEPRARQPERPRRQPWQQRPSSRRQPSAQP